MPPLFSEIQSRLAPKLFSTAGNVTPCVPSKNLLEEILTYGPEICETAFGDFGTRLYDVANELDFTHGEILSGQFLLPVNKDESLFIKLSQFLKLCQLAQEHKLDEISSIFSKCMTKAILPDVRSSLEFLKNQSHYVRLFKSVEDRERLRQVKQVRPIELASMKKLVSIWETVPDLEVYSRFGNYYKEQMDKIAKRAEIYRQLRLASMVAEVESSLKEFKESFDDVYYGFQRVPMTIVAVILAKMHNFRLDLTCGDRASKITVPSETFHGYDFVNGEIVFDSSGVGQAKAVPDYDYLPMAYPLHCLEKTEFSQRIVSHLESLPEAGNKPIFDHYVVVVPGIHYPNVFRSDGLQGRGYSFFDFQGKKRYFNDPYSARTALDAVLIKEKFLMPVLLGEKDGKCYFISFFE